MSQVISVPKGYKVTVPLLFPDDSGRRHAPVDGFEVTSSADDVAKVKLEGSSVVIQGVEPGQAAIQLCHPDDSRLTGQLFVNVLPARERGVAPEGPTSVEFDVDRAEFEGKPGPMSEESKRAKEQRERQADARTDEDRHLEEVAQDQELAEKAGAVTGQHMGVQPLQHRPPQPQDMRQNAGAAPPAQQPVNPIGGRTPAETEAEREEAERAAEASHHPARERPHLESEKKADEKKSQSAQQRGGAATTGSATSAPGSRRG